MKTADVDVTRTQNFLWSSFRTVLACFTGGKMNDAHCTVCCVDTLSASASRSERVDAKILWINVDVQLCTEDKKKACESETDE